MPRALVPCALASLVLVPSLAAQVRGDAPIAPAATIGPVTDASTLSVLGIAALPDGTGNALTQRNDVWLGATQPLGRIGRVRLAALGTGNWRVPQGVGSSGRDGAQDPDAETGTWERMAIDHLARQAQCHT